jgi:WD40 repeat protein
MIVKAILTFAVGLDRVVGSCSIGKSMCAWAIRLAIENVNFKFLLVLCLSGVCLGPIGARSAFADDSTGTRLEEMARNCSHFSLTVIVRNQGLRLWPPAETVRHGTNIDVFFKPATNELVLEQQRLAQKLRALKDEQNVLAELLGHPDPKIRTLALGAIFLREDGRDLPLIARLIGDNTSTFPDLHDSFRSEGGPHPMPEVESPQTVGEVARAMLKFWGVPATGKQMDGKGRIEKFIVTSNDFTRYWKKYSGRDHSASSFAVKMNHATGQTTPLQPGRKEEIQQVLAEMNTLPMPDRAWVQLYVLAPQSHFEFDPVDFVVTDGEIINLIKPLGPEPLLHFLQCQRISEDPDLHFDKNDARFVGMSDFLLNHADKLLRPEDADALLADQYVLRGSREVDPSWAIGASLVRPDRASQILRHAMRRETKSYDDDAGILAGALWRIRGPAELNFLVDWFYETLPTSAPNMPGNKPVAFLWEVEAAKRPDTKQLIAALVKDPRFDSTDWDTLAELLKLVNSTRSTSLVSVTDIYAAQPNGLLDERVIFSTWRNQLRHEFGLPEKLPAVSEATPKKLLNKPLWSMPLTMPPTLVVSSPNGQWLALLTDGTITVWKAATGQFWWEIPRTPRTAAYGMAFGSNGEELIVFDRTDYGQFAEWNILTRQRTSHVLLTGEPTSGVDEGAYCFDAAGRRAVFAGYNDLMCFDTSDGKALWSHPGESGVGSRAALSPDGTRLAVTGGFGNPKVVRLHDAASGKVLKSFQRFAGPVLALALSRDNRKLVTASGADGVQIWDAATVKLLTAFPFQVSNLGPGAMALSPDDQWLSVVGASSNGDTQIGVFGASNGQLNWEIQPKAGESFDPGIPAAFSPDGKILYTGSKRLEAWPLN